MCKFFRKSCRVVSRKNSGMTLVELLLVMAILSVVMLAVISLYVPTHQSAVAQSQVSDIQSGLRLALKVMTRDILHAGFLAPSSPITNYNSVNSSSFTIETRIVGTDFARISSTANLTGKIRLTVADTDMVDNFPAGALVRVFDPINSLEVKETPEQGGVTDADRVYPVVSDGSTPANAIDIDISQNSTLEAADILAEAVLVRVNSNSAPPLQTITYQLANDSLLRVINGTTQVLARNVDTDNSMSNFNIEETPEGRAEIVRIKLTAKTRALKNDAISGEKVRSVSSRVKLRNVF